MYIDSSLSIAYTDIYIYVYTKIDQTTTLTIRAVASKTHFRPFVTRNRISVCGKTLSNNFNKSLYPYKNSIVIKKAYANQILLHYVCAFVIKLFKPNSVANYKLSKICLRISRSLAKLGSISHVPLTQFVATKNHSCSR